MYITFQRLFLPQLPCPYTRHKNHIIRPPLLIPYGTTPTLSFLAFNITPSPVFLSYFPTRLQSPAFNAGGKVYWLFRERRKQNTFNTLFNGFCERSYSSLISCLVVFRNISHAFHLKRSIKCKTICPKSTSSRIWFIKVLSVNGIK